MPHYPADAACGQSDLPPTTWDHTIPGETPRQQQARWNAAAAVCDQCPVKAACDARHDQGGGVRAGIAHPDQVPNWTLAESNSWLDWSVHNIDLHGNEAGYKRHLRDGTRVCLSCLAWLRRDAKDTYRRRAAA